MAVWHGPSLRKPTGGKKVLARKKRKYELGRYPTFTRIAAAEKRKIIRVRGGNHKVRLYLAQYINVATPEGTKKVRVLEVVESPLGANAVRERIITKGCLVRTEIGLVRVTSRPGQHGVLNGVLVQSG
ncbi:MAG: 30S ribosomal protein S8e [bacterium]|nr:30S ribosomal protein S8e [bacterium]